MTPAKAFEGRESAHLAVRMLAQETKGQSTLTDGPGVGASTYQCPKPIADFLAPQHVFLPVGETLLQVEDAVRRQPAQATEQVIPQVTPDVAPHVTGEVAGEVRRLLAVMPGEMKRAEMQQVLGLRHEDHLRDAYLDPALEASVIEMTVPEKPRSSKQRYRLTERGRAVLQISDV